MTKNALQKTVAVLFLKETMLFSKFGKKCFNERKICKMVHCAFAAESLCDSNFHIQMGWCQNYTLGYNQNIFKADKGH